MLPSRAASNSPPMTQGAKGGAIFMGLNVPYKWPVGSDSVCHCFSPLGPWHRQIQLDTGWSSAQSKAKINTDKPSRGLTFTNPSILFNVLDCTLMDTSSHTLSNASAFSHLPAFSHPIQPFPSIAVSTVSQSWVGSIIQRLIGSQGGDVVFYC